MSGTLHRKRVLMHGGNALLVTLAVIGAAVVGYILVDRYRPFRFDLTRSGTYSLAPKTIEILGRLDRDVEVTFFVVPRSMSPDAPFVNQKVTDLLEEYQIRSKGHLTYTVTNPIQDEIRLQELGGDIGAAVFQSGDAKIVVQAKDIFQTGYGGGGYGGDPETKFTGEDAFDTALIQLKDGKSRTACFLSGHAEPSIESKEEEGYGLAKELLRRENLDAREISLAAVDVKPGKMDQPLLLENKPGVIPEPALAARDVPDDCTVLVIAGPRAPLQGPEADAILRWFESGHGVVIFAEPLTQSGVEGLAARFGVEILAGVAADSASQKRSPLTILPEYQRHEIVDALSAADLPVILPRAVGMRAKVPLPAEISLKPLISTSADGMELIDIKDGAADPNSPKNLKGPITLGFAIEHVKDGKTTRAVILGDSDFAKNANLQALASAGAAGNVDLLKNSVNWAAGATEKVGIGPKDPAYNTVTVSDAAGLWILFSTAVALPGGIFFSGVFVWVRRRRR